MASIISHFQTTLGAAGITADIHEILDMGNPNYSKVPEEIRAAAYLVAVDQGWQDSGISVLIKEVYGERYDQFTGDTILSVLKELATKYPNSVK